MTQTHQKEKQSLKSLSDSRYAVQKTFTFT